MAEEAPRWMRLTDSDRAREWAVVDAYSKITDAIDNAARVLADKYSPEEVAAIIVEAFQKAGEDDMGGKVQKFAEMIKAQRSGSSGQA